MHQVQFQRGYSLVEVLVAVSILLIALIGPMTIAAKGLQSAYYAREQATAVFLAQEGIELIVAIRNDEMIDAIDSGDLDDAWDWTTDNRLSSCRSGSGCNFVLSSTNNSPTLNQLAPVRSCATLSNCRLRFNANAQRSRYMLTGAGVDTPYTRVIRLTNTADGDGVIITSTVSWESGLFRGSGTSVTLSGAVYRTYE